MTKPIPLPSEISSETISPPLPRAPNTKNNCATPDAELARKMLEIMKEVKYVQKNGKNNFHNYTYATESAIVKVFREALIKHNIMMYTSIIERDTHTFKTKKGDDSFLITVKIQITFVDAQFGHSFTSYFYGDGADTGDKGLYKAITGAHKYALMKTFLLETGDDPEHDESVQKPIFPTLASKKQKDEIMELMTKTKTDTTRMKEIMQANSNLRGKNFNTITWKDAGLIIELLKKKDTLKETSNE